MKPLSFLLLFLSAVFSSRCVAQSVAINNDGSTANASSILDVKSNSKGVLIPRMTTVQRQGITNPAEGLMVYDRDKKAFMYFDGVRWQMMVPGNSSLGAKREISAATGDTTSRFGKEVAMTGIYAAIASRKQNNLQSLVYMYEKNAAGNWEQKQILTAPAPKSSDDFGFSMDMCGDYLVIGDPVRTNSSGNPVGIVYVYHRINGTWTHEATLERTNAPTNERFGFDVAISINTPQGIVVAVGIPYATKVTSTNQYHGTGKIMLYKKTGNAWAVFQTISTIDFQTGDHAGYAVDIDGDLLAVGAPHRLTNAGAVYIYRYSTTTQIWDKEYGFDNAATDNLLGYSVCVSAGRVAAGAPQLNMEKSGVVWLFTKKTNGYWEANPIHPPSGVNKRGGRAFFGASVALEANSLLIGAQGTEIQNESGSHVHGYEHGKAIVYKIRTVFGGITQYALQQIITPEFSRPDDLFAKSVALSGGNFIISHQSFSSFSLAQAGAVLFGSLD
jgi:hypothetical protein